MGTRYLKPLIIEPYQHTMYLCLGESELKALETKFGFNSGIGLGNSLGAVVHMGDESGNSFNVMYLGMDLDDSTVYHECLHLTHFMLDRVGVPINMENTELLCYTQEHVVRLVMKEIDIRLNQLIKAQEKILKKAEEEEKKPAAKKPKKKKGKK